MKTVRLVARILLGVIFLVFGLNGFLHFIPMPPPEGLAQEYHHALVASHYMDVVMGLQVVGGILLLTGHFLPLALTLLGPVIVNILLFSRNDEPKRIALGAGRRCTVGHRLLGSASSVRGNLRAKFLITAVRHSCASKRGSRRISTPIDLVTVPCQKALPSSF